MSFDLADGVTVQVPPPTPPVITIGPPRSTGVAVVVVQGPRGRPGNETDLTIVDARLDALEAGQAAPRGYVHHQNQSSTLWQIHHGLSYSPGGITVVDLVGDPVEYESVSWPLAGVVELAFGVPFAGTATVS